MMKLISVLPLSFALAACATTSGEPPVIKGDIPERGVTDGAQCDDQGLQFMMGQKATDETGKRALAQSGAKTLRWIPPGSAVTMDYRQDRLNIAYDDKMIITRISCG